MELLEKENRKQAGLPEPKVEETPKKVSTPEVKAKKVSESTSNIPQSFQDRFPEYGADLYKLAKKAVENNIEDFESFNPGVKITSKTAG